MSTSVADRKYWHRRPVFVTGATGLVGSWLIPALVQRGASVVALVRDSSPRSHFHFAGSPQEACVVRGSLGDAELLRRTMSANHIDTVFHLGAQTVVSVAKTDPVGTLEANVRGTWNVLEAARHSGVKQTLIASTVLAASTDGPRPGLHSTEGVTLVRYPYEMSKICAERIAQSYASTYNMTIGLVRFGNLYGGGDLNFSRLIPGAIRATLQGQRFHFRTSGESMRDFLYVEDAVSAYLRLAERTAEDGGLAQRQFHFGLGLRFSLLNTIRLILRLSGREDIAPIAGNSPGVEVSEAALDIAEAGTRLGWEPKFTLEDGLVRTIQWYMDYLEEKSGATASQCAFIA